MNKIETLIDTLRPVYDFLYIEEEPVKADVIFVFGGVGDERAKYAAKLWKQGFAPWVLVTGKCGIYTADLKTTEAARYRLLLIEYGVPDSAIIVEENATNFGENVRFGVEMLTRHNVTIRSVIMIARGFLMTRCSATFAIQFPDIKTFACSFPEPLVHYLSDSNDPGWSGWRLCKEVERIEGYVKEGFMASVDVPPNVLGIAQSYLTEHPEFS